MTVIAYGTSVKETAKTRRHARRRAVAMDRERIESIIDTAFGIEPEVVAIEVKHISRIEKALSSPSLRERREDDKPLLCGRKLHHVRPEATHIVNARQKLRGTSIPLI
jgi:hypothetical protein